MRYFLLIAIVASSSFAQSTTPRKKLIEFGWDEPDTAFMRKHIREMERRPFDGCVFDIKSNGPEVIRLIDQGWGKRAFTLQQFQTALDDLKATHFIRFTDNFLRFDVTPGDVDWFDDFSAILANARLAAKIAHEGKAAGLLFDVEPYAKNLWDYRQTRDKKSKTFDEYAKQTRTRGQEFMRAIQGEFPNVKIMLTFGWSVANMQTGGDRSKLPSIDYGLLPAFLNGMLDVANPRAKIIDGYELSYAYKNEVDFDEAARKMREAVLPFVSDPDQYRAHLSVGFGIWMDQDWRKYGWDTHDFGKNYFNPDSFGSSVKHALKRCDEYVWIYTEKPKWWTEPQGKPADLPGAYEQALRRARP